LIAEGCDVIAQHSNTPNPQIEAQRAGVWGVGYNSDMKNEAPDAEIASVVWKWSVYYSHLVRSVIDGSFTTKPYLGDIKDGMVELASLNEALLPPGTADVIASARARILGGFGVFDGVMETNDGQTVGQPGETLPDHTIRREVNWYYRNVVEP
jgi:basic membrane protein A